MVWISKRVVQACSEHKINASLLCDILLFRRLGYSQQNIADFLGVHRVTVNKYLKKWSIIKIKIEYTEHSEIAS